MSEEEFFKYVEKIQDEISCWNGLDNEVIKLFSLFSKCVTHIHEGQEWVNINYVREKVYNLLIKHPILLSGDAMKIYISMRIEKEIFEKAMQIEENGKL